MIESASLSGRHPCGKLKFPFFQAITEGRVLELFCNFDGLVRRNDIYRRAAHRPWDASRS